MRRLWTLALCPLLLAACSQPDNGKIQLRYMAWGNPEQLALEDRFCQEFNRQNPDIEVKLFRVPGSAYRNKMIVMMASRTAPDIMRVDHYDFAWLVRKNYFKDLTGFAASDPGFRREDFYEQTLREGEHEGRLYGLNVLFGGYMVYYNRTLLRKAGLGDPNELAARGEWTFERFRSHAIAMTERDENGRPTQFGAQIPGFPFLAPFIWGYGGDLLSKDRKRCLMDSPEAIRALQFVSDLRWKDKATPTPAQGANSAFNFESGRLGMYFDWGGMSPRFRKSIKNFEWDICPVPSGPAGRFSIAKGNQIVINAESEHPEAAWRFIRFMTGEKVEMELYGKLRRAFPTRKAVANSAEYLDNSLPPATPSVFFAGVEYGRELPIDQRWPEWTTAFNSKLDDLMSGRDRNAAAVAQRATEAANKVLADEEGF